MILKLATILRRLLHSTDSFVALREEVEFIELYLEIMVAGALRSRYGARDDPETRHHSSPPAAQHGFVRGAARGGGVHRPLSGDNGRWCASIPIRRAR